MHILRPAVEDDFDLQIRNVFQALGQQLHTRIEFMHPGRMRRLAGNKDELVGGVGRADERTKTNAKQNGQESGGAMHGNLGFKALTKGVSGGRNMLIGSVVRSQRRGGSA